MDGAGHSCRGVTVSVSDDAGRTWRSGSLRIVLQRLGVGAVTDPDAVLLPDGRIRLYFVSTDRPTWPGVPPENGRMRIDSAISRDGIHFLQEPGARYDGVGRFTDPDVARFGERWLMYLAMGERLFAATSEDGKTFRLLGEVRARGTVSQTVSLGDGACRQYYCRDGIRSAVSRDGLHWWDEAGVRVTAGRQEVPDPAVIRVPGGWDLYFKKVEPGRRWNRAPCGTTPSGVQASPRRCLRCPEECAILFRAA